MNRYQKMNHLLFLRKEIGLTVVVVVLAMLVARPIWRALAAAGDYDTTFSGDGKIPELTDSVTCDARIAIQHDGKTLALVWEDFNASSQLVRLRTNGLYDNSFGGDGKLSVNLGGTSSLAIDLAIQANGRIVVVGYQRDNQGTYRLAIVRYLPNGNLDTSLDGDGRLIGELYFVPRSVAIQPDSKILVAGGIPNGGNGTPVIARYNSNGALDTSFGYSGYVYIYDSGSMFEQHKITVQSDGKILISIGGSLRRYLASGQLDTTFGSNGIVAAEFIDFELLADGKIVAIIYRQLGNPRYVIQRFLPSGLLDTTFSETALSDSSWYVALAVQEDGRLIVTGHYGATNFARINSNGGLDTSFGSEGYKQGEVTHLTDVALMVDQRIVVIGAQGCAYSPPSMARYKNDNTDTQTTDLSVGPITISPTTVNAGTIVAYTIPVKNNSTTKAAHVTLTMNVPNGTSYQKVVLPAGWAVMQEPSVGAMGTVTLASYQLAAGVTTKPRLEVRVNPTGGPAPTISMSATVSNTITDTVPSNNTGYKVFTVQ